MSLQVLLVEDDRDLRATLRQALEVEGYEVLAAASLADAQALLAHAARAVDLVLLDLGLPDGDGAQLLAGLRREQATPVLVLSARSGDAQKIGLLDAGADDYLVKPFAIGELLARMRVALRHRGTHRLAPVTHYRLGALEIDLPGHRVLRDGAPVHLTPTEFKLLARLARSAGQVVTHRQLLADVWGADCVEQTHYLRLYMGQLRAKLEADPSDPRCLLTEPGVGYRLGEGPGH
ncbi:response regulator with CheY-like receiver domain and winged-helix DNA-binding domain [Burkholderiales bacterium JOSHI_001]|nr:response regulator with CheY-like receiver domain and winged-helix DNA-binding domain [Burkholderiales bacterium JOSHI_001]